MKTYFFTDQEMKDFKEEFLPENIEYEKYDYFQFEYKDEKFVELNFDHNLKVTL